MSPPPCLYDTVIQSYVQLKSGFYGVGPYGPYVWTPLKVNGATLGRSCPPGVQLLPHFEVWSYRACQTLQMWQISHFCEIHSLSYEASKFFTMLSLCVFWAAISPLGRTSYPRSLIKVIAHHSRLGRTFWHLIHGSVTKTAGGVARRKKVEEE